MMSSKLSTTEEVKKKRTVPFEFVLDELADLNPYTKPMFGCEAVYIEEKIVLILRRRDSHLEDNGVWVATTAEHHQSLKRSLPSLRSIAVFGPGPTGWQVLPEDSDDFEESVLKACELIRRADPRIGKTPKSRLRSQPRVAKTSKVKRSRKSSPH